MKVNVYTKNIELKDDEKKYIEKKVEKIDRVLKGDNIEISVRTGKDIDANKGKIYFTSIEIKNLSNGDIYEATEYAESVKASVDLVKDKILKEIRRKKCKVKRFVRNSGRKIKNLIKKMPWKM